MRPSDFDFMATVNVRRAMVAPGDIRADIEFQNDINNILAGLDENVPAIVALAWNADGIPLPPQQQAQRRRPAHRATDRANRLADIGAPPGAHLAAAAAAAAAPAMPALVASLSR